uniref:Small ribosomal subunit protein uS3m n=1 Tax=Microbotryum cf. violaceum BFL-2013 TaxID=1288119 RepID=M1GLY0_9BASI|nr:ribosomal protein S3 [Microbotryum cf. violaceum BFL-2013]AGE14657.1 ribosomal protein S3 [Microbotryum cf. violaceum BFL-2013]
MTTTTYMFGKSNRRNLTSIQRQALSIIQSFFYSSVLPQVQNNVSAFPFSYSWANKENGGVLLGKPLFTVTADKVTIQLFYCGASDNSIGAKKLSSLGSALTRCWSAWFPEGKGTVELQVIKINYSVLDSSIFSQYLTHNASKYSFNRILDMLKNSLPTVSSDGSLDSTLNPTSHITGIKVKLSGRLVTQASGPRQTVQAGRIGSSSRGLYSAIDYSQHTNKNKLGAFTMKVWISQQSR